MLKEKLVDFVHPLLLQLAEAKSKSPATTCDHELFEKMEKAVRSMEVVCLRLEKWEREVQGSVEDITKLLNDMLEDGVDQDGGFQSKLQDVDKEVAALEIRMTLPLDLPDVGKESSSYNHSPSSSTHSPHLMKLDDLLGVADFVRRYEELSPVLQKCLLSLCIFPKDAVIKKRLLIYWWIGEGLATPINDRTAQEDGERLFQVLIDEGFMIPIYRDHNSATDSCRVPHSCRVPLWVRYELGNIADANPGFRRYRFGEPIGSLAAPCSTRLLVDEPEKQELRSGRSDPPNPLTTYFNVNRHNLKLARGEFPSTENIAVLQLGRWQSSARHHVEVDNTEFLESSFKTLRYLSLQGISRIKELPASTGELTNLMILDLRDCNNLERLPVEITMLCRLTHLDVSECYFLDHMPKGLNSLSELQVLKGFVVASSTSRNPCRLAELSKLKRLRKLSLRIGRDSLVADGELRELNKFEALRSLTISWEGKLSSSSSHQELRYLDDVSLPSRLEKLDLRCFPGSTAPEWLNPSLLVNLKKLYIRGGSLCGFGGTPPRSVRILRLRFLNEFHMEEARLQELFPTLDFLEIHKCENMSSTARRFERHL